MRVVRAFLKAAAFFVKRNPGFIAFLVIWGSIAGYFVVNAPATPVETPQQQQARVNAEAQREAQEKGRKEITRLLCAQKSACSKYGQARQECAVAGNFENCLEVKMGSDDYALKGICTEDGKVGGIADRDIPDPVTCFTSGL